jgi:GTP-sensing pleiotropic transcriptional regulator CodY
MKNKVSIDEFLKIERQSLISNPLVKQLNEVCGTLDTLLDNCEATDQLLKNNIAILKNSTQLLQYELYTALKSDDFLDCMQRASIVRQYADSLRSSSQTLIESNEFDNTYISVFRDEMEKFRELFRDWAHEIKQMDRNGLDDEWGLF